MSANPWLYAFVIGALLTFGLAYDAFVSHLERRGYDRGYTALLVVVGCFVTLLGLGVLAGWHVAALAFGLFAASGAPMVIGSWLRHVRGRERDEETARQAAREELQ